jgi:hypothetical protein
MDNLSAGIGIGLALGIAMSLVWPRSGGKDGDQADKPRRG